jgi:hypothetical protein
VVAEKLPNHCSAAKLRELREHPLLGIDARIF